MSQRASKSPSDQAAELERRDLEATELSRKAAEKARADAEMVRAAVDVRVKNYCEEVASLEDPQDEPDTAVHKLSEIMARAAARTGEVVTLPAFVVEASPAGPITVRPIRDNKPRIEQVLVVDDHVDVADVIAEVLKHEGYYVRTAGDGVEALHKALKDKPSPDVLVLDLGLPFLSGEGVIAALQTTHLAAIPVIFISGSPKSDVPDHVRGDHIYLQKSPRVTEELKAALLKLVAQRVAEWRAAGPHERPEPPRHD